MKTTHKIRLWNGMVGMTCVFVLAGCAGRPADVPEIHRGILQGYLAADEYPNSGGFG